MQWTLCRPLRMQWTLCRPLRDDRVLDAQDDAATHATAAFKVVTLGAQDDAATHATSPFQAVTLGAISLNWALVRARLARAMGRIQGAPSLGRRASKRRTERAQLLLAPALARAPRAWTRCEHR